MYGKTLTSIRQTRGKLSKFQGARKAMKSENKKTSETAKENLFFNFEDNNTKVPFKINLMSVLDCFNFLIQNEKIKDFPETVKNEIAEKYGVQKKFYNYQYEEIDTFDYENESKRSAEFWQEEKDYEEYIKKNTRY